MSRAMLKHASGRIEVSAKGRGQFRSIGEAVAEAEPGATIVVLPGVYEECVTLDRRVEVMAAFPEEKLISGLQDGWHSTAKCVYRNWLQYLLANRANAPVFTSMATACGASQGKRSAIG